MPGDVRPSSPGRAQRRRPSSRGADVRRPPARWAGAGERCVPRENVPMLAGRVCGELAKGVALQAYVEREVLTATDAELAVDPGQVLLDGADRDEELRGD